MNDRNRRFVLMLNPKARSGDIINRLSKLLKIYPELNFRSEIVIFHSTSEIGRKIAGISSDKIPVACGGDGTVNSLVRIIYENEQYHLPIGVIPLGVGNAYAYSIGIHSMGQAIDTLLKGEIHPLDVMITDHHQAPVVLVSISIGFESLFLEKYGRLRKFTPLMGTLGGLMWSAGRYHTGSQVEINGRTVVSPKDSFYNVGLYNMASYAFGWRLPPGKNPQDGVAEAVINISSRTYWEAMFRAIFGLKPANTERFYSQKWQNAYIQTTLPVQVDGESITPGTFSIELKHQGVMALIPKGN